MRKKYRKEGIWWGLSVAYCMQRARLPKMLKIAHDDPSCGHFGFPKKIALLRDFQWPRKIRDVERYFRGCDD